MKLDVSDALSHPGQEYLFSGLQAIADQEIGGDTVRIDDCAVEGEFLSDEEGNISVRGKLKTVAHAPCANCLEDAQAEIENEFDETFIRNGDMEDNEIFAYQGHEVSLDKVVMSYAVMALPIRFLCREDCPGFEYRDPEAVPSAGDPISVRGTAAIASKQRGGVIHGSSERENLEGSQTQPPRQLEAVSAGDRQMPPVRTDEAVPSRVQELRLL